MSGNVGSYPNKHVGKLQAMATVTQKGEMEERGGQEKAGRHLWWPTARSLRDRTSWLKSTGPVAESGISATLTQAHSSSLSLLPHPPTQEKTGICPAEFYFSDSCFAYRM